jgi:hypothetical protein
MGTGVLFVEPSFGKGAARAIDFWGDLTVYNISQSPEAADSLALFMDFHQVGLDLAGAMCAAKAEMEAGHVGQLEEAK